MNRLENCHLHLTGSLTAHDLRQISAHTDSDISPFEPLEEQYQFDNTNIWAAAKQLTSTPAGFLAALKQVITREANEGVGYVEITFNPYGMHKRGMSALDMARAVAAAAELAENRGTELKVKCGINRKDDLSTIATVVEAYDALPADVRLAIDVNGAEKTFPTRRLAPVLEQLPGHIPKIIHAGEYPGTRQSLVDAIVLKPLRLAHAVMAADDDRLLEQIADAGIAIEVAPTSNTILGCVTTSDPLPARRFADYNIPILAGTDDPAFFNTTLRRELDILETHNVYPTPVNNLK